MVQSGPKKKRKHWALGPRPRMSDDSTIRGFKDSSIRVLRSGGRSGWVKDSRIQGFKDSRIPAFRSSTLDRLNRTQSLSIPSIALNRSQSPRSRSIPSIALNRSQSPQSLSIALNPLNRSQSLSHPLNRSQSLYHPLNRSQSLSVHSLALNHFKRTLHEGNRGDRQRLRAIGGIERDRGD